MTGTREATNILAAYPSIGANAESEGLVKPAIVALPVKQNLSIMI
jgi:hypothetical protein